MLQWLLDEAASRKSADLGVTQRVLLVNFAAIHTSSMVRLPPYSMQFVY